MIKQASGDQPRSPPAGILRPLHPGFLHVGRRQLNAMDIWLSTSARHPPFRQTFHDINLNRLQLDGLAYRIAWHPEFMFEPFPGSTSVEQQEAQRLHLNDIIWANTDHNTITIDEPPALDNSNPLRGNATLPHAGHRSIERADTTSEVLFKTVLVVSASNRSNDAHAHVYLNQHWTVPETFESLLNECNIRGQAAETVSSIKATLLWSKRAQLLRNDKLEDWDIFAEALRWAWKTHRNYFVENGCEIEMILCVEEGA